MREHKVSHTNYEYLREIRHNSARAKLLFGEEAFASRAAHPDSPRRCAIALDLPGGYVLLGCGPDWDTAFHRAAEEFPRLWKPGHLPHLRETI